MYHADLLNVCVLHETKSNAENYDRGNASDVCTRYELALIVYMHAGDESVFDICARHSSLSIVIVHDVGEPDARAAW